MQIKDLIHRAMPPEPWDEGEKIPWNDPDFSKRMLKEHLTQDHDLASRRFEIIDQHVTWIHEHLLNGTSGKVLDLACGPGLYSSRLSKLGHTCLGIDFSPASIDYAKQQAEEANLEIDYVLQDVRQAEYGQGVDLAMFLYGEINVFQLADFERIMKKALDALNSGGRLILEPQTESHIRRVGQAQPTWFTAETGLFSERAHVGLLESFWIEDQKTNIERYYITDAETGEITRYAASSIAYSDSELADHLRAFGFTDVQIYPSWPNVGETTDTLFLATATKP